MSEKEEVKAAEFKAPKWPYVQFRRVKVVTTKENPNGVEVVEDYALRVDGCHGQPEALTEVIKGGAKLIGGGNLEAEKYKAIRAFVARTTGENLHPLLKEKTVTEKKVDAAKAGR